MLGDVQQSRATYAAGTPESLQAKVQRKFLQPENWVWTSRYLELASNQLTAEMTASFFPPGIRVVDIGCGGGADATSLVKQREVLAIDRNPLAIQLTQANWQLQSSDRGVLNAKVADAENVKIDSEDFVHLDPDRRQEDRAASV